MRDRPRWSQRVFGIDVMILTAAATVPLLATRVLSALNVPLGKPGTFVYLYSPWQPLRMVNALPMLLAAAACGAAVLLAADARPSRRRAGLLLGAAVIAATAAWSYLGPPLHLSQHIFTLQSPSHDGAFVSESARVGSVRDYLAAFPRRARTPEHVMRGTRVISNPPATTLLALAVRRAVQRWPALAALASRGFAAEFEGLPASTLENATVAIVFAWVLTALWAVSGVSSYALARLFLEPAPALTVAMCCIISPMTLTLTPGKDPAQLLTTTAGLYLWLLAYRRRSSAAAAAAGVTAALSVTVGLVHVWVGLIVLAATAWHALRDARQERWLALRVLTATLLPGLLAAVVTCIVLYVAFDWNVVATAHAAAKSQAEVTRGEGAMPWVWQSLGVPLFLLFAGPALWSLMLWQTTGPVRSDHARLGRAFVLLSASVMLATVGFTNVETPRLWIPFVPLLLLGAALRCRAFVTHERRHVRLLAALVACQIAASAIQWTFMDMRETEMRLSEQRYFH